MAQTKRSTTVVLPNGNRVTVSTGGSGYGYYKTVTVKRPDGTGESKTERRGSGALSPFGGPYDDSIPVWAQGGSTSTPVLVGSPAHRASKAARRSVFVILVVVVAAFFLIRAGIHALTRTSYGDGRSWVLQYEYGYHVLLGKQLEVFPGCKHSYMASSGLVLTPQSIFKSTSDVQGAGEPGDNYAQWRKGCLSARNDHQWARR